MKCGKAVFFCFLLDMKGIHFGSYLSNFPVYFLWFFFYLARKQEIIKITEQLIEAVNNGDFEAYAWVGWVWDLTGVLILQLTILYAVLYVLLFIDVSSALHQ